LHPSTAVKEIKKFQLSLNVQSDVHRKQDRLQRLKQLICDLDKFIQEGLPFKLPSDLQEAYDTGFKGIVKEAVAKTIRKPQKPELNTEDLVEDYYYSPGWEEMF
jgi:hypothetical protein